MRWSFALAAALALAGVARAEEPKAPAADKKPAADAKKAAPADDKTLYAVGLAVAKSLEVFSLKGGEVDKVIAGIRDGVAGKPKENLEAMQPKIQELAKSRMAVVAEKEKEKGVGVLDRAAKEKGAVKTANGTIVIPEKEGTGATPAATDKVKVHYTGTLPDGKVFDSSVQRGQPAEFPLNGVIPCWTEGLQKMKVGGKAKLVCPANVAYGEQGRPPVIPGNAVLTFQVELLDIVK